MVKRVAFLVKLCETNRVEFANFKTKLSTSANRGPFLLHFTLLLALLIVPLSASMLRGGGEGRLVPSPKTPDVLGQHHTPPPVPQNPTVPLAPQPRNEPMVSEDALGGAHDLGLPPLQLQTCASPLVPHSRKFPSLTHGTTGAEPGAYKVCTSAMLSVSGHDANTIQGLITTRRIEMG